MDPAPLLGLAGLFLLLHLSLSLQIDVVMKPGWLVKASPLPPFSLYFPSYFSKAPVLSMTGHPPPSLLFSSHYPPSSSFSSLLFSCPNTL